MSHFRRGTFGQVYRLPAVLTVLLLFATIRPALGVEPGLLKALGFEPQTVRPAPNFTLPDLNGGNKKLSDWRGKPVLIIFWATW